MDESAYRWEKALGPRHRLVVGFRELAADARALARSPSPVEVVALADRAEATNRELQKLVARERAAGRRSRAAAASKGKRKKTPRPRLRLLRG